MIKRALISVSNKNGLDKFAKFLAEKNVEILSTGGTATYLRSLGLNVKDVSEVTEFPEMMDGRVKTLHPRIHGGLLARRNMPEHLSAADEHGIPMIDLLVVNLYPFEETIAKTNDLEICVENIDIGGPAMIRAASKNYADVAVVTDPDDYENLMQEWPLSLSTRQKLSAKAFAHTSYYDGLISNWMREQWGRGFPKELTSPGKKRQELRYGENPHQHAAYYEWGGQGTPFAKATCIQGKELSYNNLLDADAAYALVQEFSEATVSIIKHTNPCGVATGANLVDAYHKALRCDPVSAFGGIIAVNRPLDVDFIESLGDLFLEVLIAPSITNTAKEFLAKKKNLRVLVPDASMPAHKNALTVRSLSGSFLMQSADEITLDQSTLKVVTKRQPTAQEMKDLIFAWTVAKHVKSNAIVYAKDLATVGIGAGQMSRVDSARMAAWKAEGIAQAENLSESLTVGSVASSDAFFPFADGLLAVAAAGSTAIIQPGGSIRDDEVIAAANEKDLAMVFTGIRHFRH